MKAIIIESTWIRPHLETAGEIALNLTKNNNKIKFAWVGHNLDWNDWEIPKFLRLLGCSPENRVNKFLEILNSNNIEIIKNQNNINKNYIRKWSNSFNGNLKNLKKFKYKNTPLGMGVASSLITLYNDKNIRIINYINKVRKFLYSSALVYERCLKILEKHKPNKVFTFNNRFGLSLPIILACYQKKIQVIRHDRGANYKKYFLFNYDINDPRNFKFIYSNWKKLKKIKKKKDAHSFFSKKFNSTFLDEVNKNFTKTQLKNCIPEIPKNKKIITYFTSTEYESSAYINLKYDQMKVFEKFIKSLKKIKDFHMIVRVHPSLTSKDDFVWQKYKSDNVTIVGSNSKFDTYAIMKKSDVVCGYSSRIVLESAYLGIPTLSFKDFGWPKNIGILYGENSKIILSNLKKALKNKVKFNLDKILATAHFYLTYGTYYKHYDPITINKGKFLKRDLEWKSNIVKLFELFGFKLIYTKISNFLFK